MKTQIFNDGNKRASVIFANHYLISHAGGLLVIPENHVPKFKKLLIGYYEDKDNCEIKEFLKQNCHRNFR
jgi:prophage maintenance system killer protein